MVVSFSISTAVVLIPDVISWCAIVTAVEPQARLLKTMLMTENDGHYLNVKASASQSRM